MENGLLDVRSKQDPRIDGRRARAPQPRRRSPVVLAVAVVSTIALGCASLPPVRSLRAARYYAAGTDALDRGDSSVAITELERAAALMPTASEIQNHLGLAYWSDGREAAALRALERAVELDCDNEAARANLASLHRARGASGTAAATDATVGEGEGGVDDEERNASNGG